jgi:hypothetical protein
MVRIEEARRLALARSDMRRLTIGRVGYTSFESRSVWVLNHPYLPGEIAFEDNTYPLLIAVERLGTTSTRETLWDVEIVRMCRSLRQAGINHFLATDWDRYKVMVIYIEVAGKPVRPSGGFY